MVFTFIYMRKGFSYIELVISLGIFIVISGLMLANFRAGDNANELQKSADLLAASIREAQTRALSGVGGVGIVGHGVYLLADDTKFVSYADSGATAYAYDSSEATVTTNLLDNVQISQDVDILFSIPTGNVYESGALQTKAVTITLTHTITGLMIDVVVSPYTGQVTIGNPY